MLVTVTTLSDKMFCFDISPDMNLAALKDLCSVEFKVPAALISLFLNGNLLDNDAKKLEMYGITNGEMLLMEAQERSLEAPWPRYMEGRENAADFYNAEVQRNIEEKIRFENVERNRMEAMEYYPESFGSVYMLYIDCLINNVPLKAYVDSGAQCSVISKACAEKCNLMRLADTRYVGKAVGVGEQNFIGRIHLAQLQIGNDFLNCSFMIIEEQKIDFLLGLDMLRRFQCSIELKSNELVIGTTNTRVQFLSEADLPKYDAFKFEKNEPSTQVEKHILPSDARQSADGINESHIQMIVSNGFSREQAIEVLREARGNVDVALSSLIARSLVFD